MTFFEQKLRVWALQNQTVMCSVEMLGHVETKELAVVISFNERAASLF